MQNWLLRRAQLTPQRIALVEGVQSWTWAEIAELAEQRARWIQAYHRSPRVALRATNSVESVLWLWGALTAGKAVALLNPRLADVELAPLISRLEVDAVLPPPTWSAPSAAEEPAPHPQWRSWELDDHATIMFTSGSTGAPKAIIHSFGNHWASATASALNLGIERDPAAWVCAVPVCHVSGFSMLVKSVLYGSTVHLLPRFDAAIANRLLLSGEAGYMSVVPTMLRAMLDDLGPRKYPASVRALLLGGSGVDSTLIDVAEDAGAPVIYSYGMTETASQVIAFPPGRRLEAPGASGLPLFSTEVRIREGRLELRSPAVCVGYLGDPEGYAAAWTPDRWFRTHDVASIDGDGFVTVHARSTELIISGGENIYPSEIVTVLRSFSGVVDAVVVGVPDHKWGHVPAAMVASATAIEPESLRRHCQSRIAAFKVPRHVMVIDELPLLTSGKPDVMTIEKMLLAHAGLPS